MRINDDIIEDEPSQGAGESSFSSSDEPLKVLRSSSESLLKHPKRSRSHRSGGIHIPRTVLIGIGVALLIGLFAVVGLLERSCPSSPETAVVPSAEQNQGQEQADPQPMQEQADFSRLPASLDVSVVQGLVAQADDARVVSIVNNAQLYAASGEAEQAKLLKLAAEEPLALDYLANLPARYPESSAAPYDDSVTKGEIPRLYQWDERWGYTSYCGLSFGSAGCCPTALSMVYMGLTGNTDKTPYDMGVLATKGGYAFDGQGTVGDFLVDVAPDLGLECARVNVSAQTLEKYLRAGFAVVCNVGPGDFTTSGHFIVACGVADDGGVIINDPFSETKSMKTWDASTLAGQSIALYAFRAAS